MVAQNPAAQRSTGQHYSAQSNIGQHPSVLSNPASQTSTKPGVRGPQFQAPSSIAPSGRAPQSQPPSLAGPSGRTPQSQPPSLTAAPVMLELPGLASTAHHLSSQYRAAAASKQYPGVPSHQYHALSNQKYQDMSGKQAQFGSSQQYQEGHSTMYQGVPSKQIKIGPGNQHQEVPPSAQFSPYVPIKQNQAVPPSSQNQPTVPPDGQHQPTVPPYGQHHPSTLQQHIDKQLPSVPPPGHSQVLNVNYYLSFKIHSLSLQESRSGSRSSTLLHSTHLPTLQYSSTNTPAFQVLHMGMHACLNSVFRFATEIFGTKDFFCLFLLI